MKKRKIIVNIAIITATVVLFIVADVGISFMRGFINWTRKYNQAEPLVAIVWPMTSDIQEFQMAKGTLPTSLQELAVFSGTTQCMALATYSHEFTRGTNIVFRMMVNDMFGFKVDTNYTPKWIFPPDGIWTTPKKSTPSWQGNQGQPTK